MKIGLGLGPRCKYCKSVLQVSPIVNEVPAERTFRIGDPALLCPVCDVAGKLPEHRDHA